jgi:hypothetical protein
MATLAAIRAPWTISEQHGAVRHIGLAAGIFLYGWGLGLASQRQDLSSVAADALFVGLVVLALIAIVSWARRNDMTREVALFTSLFVVCSVVVIALTEPDLPSWDASSPLALALGGTGLLVWSSAGTRYTRIDRGDSGLVTMFGKRYVAVESPNLQIIRLRCLLSTVVVDLRPAGISGAVEVRIWALWSSITLRPPPEPNRMARQSHMLVYGNQAISPVDDDVPIKIVGTVAYGPLVVSAP